jgi:arylsulfatase A-like enzyme
MKSRTLSSARARPGPLDLLVFALLLGLVLAACLPAPAEAGEDKPTAGRRRPNFVVFLIDDMGWSDLGCTGSDLYRTPQIDALAAGGLRFSTGYSACTVCSPTRAALLTGQYPARLRVTDWIEGHVARNPRLRIPDWTKQLEERHLTLAEALRDAGYFTASVGKWHLAPPNGPVDGNGPTLHGFQVNIGGNRWGQPGSYFHPFGKPGTPQQVVQFPPEPSPAPRRDDEYLTDRLTAEAVRIIRENREKPFFIYFPHYAVHTPLMGQKELVAQYQALVKPDARHRNPVYAAMVESVDRSVGAVRAALAQLGLDRDTVIVFTSDNGGLLGGGKNPVTDNRPLRAGKGSAYEGGVRVPWIVNAPGLTPAGVVCDEPVITVDLMPTLLELAGVTLEPAQREIIDGLSLAPLLRNPKAGLGREAIYWHYPHYHPGGATPYSAVRAGDYRLVHFFEDDRVELYDLSKDPSERNDVAAGDPARTKELRARLDAWRKSVNAQLPTINPDWQAVPAGKKAGS